MNVKTQENFSLNLCGKRIVSIKPSDWSGEVHALNQNNRYMSMTLDDGTVLEIGSLFIHVQPKEVR